MFNLIVNFKSNLTLKEYLNYIEVVEKGLAVLSNTKDINLIFCPSFPYLHLFGGLVSKYSFVKLGAQTVSAYLQGAYSGEVNYLQLSDFCTTCIVGHSERRKYFKENNEEINLKISNLLTNNITPIVCVTNIEELNSIKEPDRCVVAFEPFEYIGGKVSAPISVIDDFYKKSNLSAFIYGGSINFDNFADYFELKYIKGFLIGSAGLNAIELLKILQKTNTLL